MATAKKISASAKSITPTTPPASKIPVKAPVSKTPVKKVVTKKPLSKSVASTKPVKTVRLEKPKKPKLIRDSFTIPKAEYLVLDDLKQRAAKLTRPTKKSELLRAGIKALAALSDAAFLVALEQVPAIKTGRPASEK
ncbi:MAG: hypothetical protein H7228_04620 [Polaromonas sp.]|nr:hypothetical protein [Polaromonas sp.]